MRQLGLRLRFGLATLLLVATTVIASVWTLAALSRLSGVVTDTVRESEAVTGVTAQLSGALEREDDGGGHGPRSGGSGSPEPVT